MTSFITLAFGRGPAVCGFVVSLISDRSGRKSASVGLGLPLVLASLSRLTIDNLMVMTILDVFRLQPRRRIGGHDVRSVSEGDARQRLAERKTAGLVSERRSASSKGASAPKLSGTGHSCLQSDLAAALSLRRR